MRKKVRGSGPASVAAAIGAAVLLLSTPTALAQANRVFASARSGSDTNACNDIATPCQTLQGAVNQVAAGGTVLVLDSGAYGPVSIGKAVTIEAPTGVEAFIHPPSGTGIQINAGGSDVVVLRGLTVVGGPNSQSSGDGGGILLIAGGALHVERCVVQGFYGGITAASGSGTTVSDAYIEDSVVRDCIFSGIGLYTFTGTVRGTVDRCTVVNNIPGIGVDVDSDSRVAVWDSVAAGNGLGISCIARTGRTTRVVVERCLSTNNAVAGVQEESEAATGGILWLSNSTVTGNGGPSAPNWTGIRQLQGGQFLSRLDNTVEGNHIDEYGTIGTYSPK